MTNPEENNGGGTPALIEKRVRLWFSGSPQGPAIMELFPSARCNLNCLFCRRSDHYPAFRKLYSEVPDARYRALIGEGIALGVREVSFKGGGEPLVRRDLVEFAAPGFARAGVRGMLITNGTLLDENLVSVLTGNGWGEVTISLDSADAAAHDHIRQKEGAFSLATGAARRLSGARARGGFRGPSLKFHAVLTSLNAAAVARLVALAADCGADAFELDSLDDFEPSAAALKLAEADEAAFQAGLENCLALASKLKISTNLSSFRKLSYVRRETPAAKAAADGAPPCLYPWFQISVQANGSIVPCCVAGMRNDGGRMHDMTLEEAWFGRDMKEIRAAMTSGTMPAFCAHCSPLQMDLNARLSAALAASTEPLK